MTPPQLPDWFWRGVCRWTTGGPWPPVEASAADALLEACRSHELLPLLANAAHPPAMVAEALERQRGWLRLYEQRATLFAQGVAEAERLLHRERYVFLKGVDYAERLYGGFGLRPMKDIDVLVPASRFEQCCSDLQAAGLEAWFPGTPATRAPAYHERAFGLGELTLEIHQAFIQRPRHRIDYDALWSRVILDSGTGRLVLPPGDAIAYHALVLGGDQFQVRLSRYADLHLLLERFPEALGEAARRAREWKAARAFYGTFSMACRLFPEFATSPVRAAMTQVLPRIERKLVDSWVLPRASEWGVRRLPARPVQLWRKLALMDDWGRRSLFVLEHLRSDLQGRWGLGRRQASRGQ